MTKPHLKQKYEKQLGMTLGKARNVLYAKMLLHYAKESGNDFCSKCNQPIDLPSEVSLDHIIPWRNSEQATELYFDINNVSLAHKKCNKVDRPGRISLPEGMSYCSKHKEFHPIEEFGKGPRWNGLAYVCLKIKREEQAKRDAQYTRFSCPSCGNLMRKKCKNCGHELTMAKYMALRREEGAQY